MILNINYHNLQLVSCQPKNADLNFLIKDLELYF